MSVERHVPPPDARLDAGEGPIEPLRRLLSRAGTVGAGLLLMAGLGVAVVLDRPAASTPVLALAVGLLAAIPVLNVAAVLFEEVRRRDWAFVAAALLVLLFVAWNVVQKVR